MTSPEAQRIEQVLRGVLSDADRRSWESLTTRFVDDAVLDYGSPERLTPGQIVSRWRPLLSAFDSTEHVLRDVVVQQDGDRATARSGFSATHRIASDAWVLEGRYEHEVVRTPRGWRVAKLRMVPGASSGNATLLERAKEQAQRSVRQPPAGVRLEHVRFESHGTPLVGTLYVPERMSTGERAAAVVVTGSWLTVKEQMPTEYARRLAAEGLVALVFDFRGFGESGGAPRQYESPARKVQDLQSAISFLEKHAAVDPARIALWGICASSGYAAQVATADPRVRRLVLVAPWLHDRPLVEAMYGGERGVRERSSKGRAAKELYDRGGEPEYVPAASNTDSTAAMYWEGNALDYYLNPARGAIPEWTNRFAVQSWPEWLELDAVAIAPNVKAPTLLVHGEKAAIPDGAKRFYEGLRVPKELVWTDAASQFHFYDDPASIAPAIAAGLRHLADR